MTAVRRMKLEMTRKHRASWQQIRKTLTPNDRVEVDRFSAFLRDSAAGMKLPELIAKHGADYLGFTEDELAKIGAKA